MTYIGKKSRKEMGTMRDRNDVGIFKSETFGSFMVFSTKSNVTKMANCILGTSTKTPRLMTIFPEDILKKASWWML